ncbi:MAG: hypothetical protein ACLS8R_06350 [Anaeromassilibacillus sp.]
MTEDLQELLFALCAAPGTPGDESEAARRAAWELSDCGETEIDRMGNVIAAWGTKPPNSRFSWTPIWIKWA